MTNDEAIKVLNTFKDLNNQMQPKIVLDAVDTAINALESRRWIPVTERLPEGNFSSYFIKNAEYPYFIVMIKSAEIPTTLQYDGVDFCEYNNVDEMWEYYNVTHWMPLPQPPKPPEPFPKGAVVEDDKSETILTEVKALIDSFEEELLSRACQYGDEIEDIESAEELDAVPVVRCKDCIHFREDGYCIVLMGYCGNEDWFCASGRRKERR